MACGSDAPHLATKNRITPGIPLFLSDSPPPTLGRSTLRELVFLHRQKEDGLECGGFSLRNLRPHRRQTGRGNFLAAGCYKYVSAALTGINQTYNFI